MLSEYTFSSIIGKMEDKGERWKFSPYEEMEEYIRLPGKKMEEYIRKDNVHDFRVDFDSAEEAYQAGTDLTGTVTLHLREAMKVASVRVQCFGRGKVKWFDSSATGDGADPVYRGSEVYIDKEIHLYQSSSHHGDLLAKGPHEYTFSFPLPTDLPSSFEGEYGFIRYTCNAHVYRPGSTLADYTYRRIISISRKLDLNDEPQEIRTTVVGEQVQPVTCCCLMAGKVHVRFHMDRRAYVPGEEARWKAEVRQDTRTSVVKCVSVTLKQFIDYTGVSDAFFSTGKPKRHFQKLSVCSKHHAGPRKGEPLIWEGHMPIPALPPSRLDGCTLMSIAYALQFKAVVSFGPDVKMMTNLVLGTVPMVNHFRPPPYTSDDSAANAGGPASASLVPLLPPAVNWNLPVPEFEKCKLALAQKRLPDAECEFGEAGVKFIPRYPVYKNQPIFAEKRSELQI